jgi:hypothetical protein
MAKIFYCGGLSGHLGMLRAVIPVADLSGVLSQESPKYVGKSFPKIKQTGLSCTVIEVVPDEKHGQWRVGHHFRSVHAIDAPIDQGNNQHWTNWWGRGHRNK